MTPIRTEQVCSRTLAASQARACRTGCGGILYFEYVYIEGGGAKGFWKSVRAPDGLLQGRLDRVGLKDFWKSAKSSQPNRWDAELCQDYKGTYIIQVLSLQKSIAESLRLES